MKPIQHKTHYNHFTSSVSRKPIFIFFFVFLMQKTTPTVALHSFDYPGNETDHTALLAIKRQLVNHPDGVLSSWNNSVHHCNWEGITCGRKHKRVTRLDLHSRGLSGTVSPFIGNLTFLNTISLYNNSLYGRIPNNLGDLFKLQILWLYNNTLIGEIPANISSCINLRSIEMEFNKLDGNLPAGLRGLSKLEDLSVNHNNLTGPLFDIIQNLTSLRQISTTYNSFTGTIPNSISRMQNLINLGLAGNRLYGTLPASLFNLSSLQILELSGNQFNGELPPHMGFNVPGLVWLGFSGNHFSGSIPTLTNFTNLKNIEFEGNSFTGRVSIDFGQFHNLQIFALSHNYLEGDINFISTLINSTRLRVLDLGTNDFSGVLPKSVSNLSTTLTYLLIGDSLISGTLPVGITNLVNLQLLDMSHSKLTSSIPHDLGKLYKMENFDLSFNRLIGNIPNSLGNLSHLSKLYLNDNKLEGNIPQSIRDCGGLIDLSLSNNELNGTLENNLFKGSATFVELDLSHNHLEGPLPLEISKQTSLGNLRLSKNRFSGVLPDGLSECTDLQYLYMDGNSFHGDIPSSFASLIGLQEIDFSQNNLSGQIPAFLSKIPSIYYLDLSHNNFEGSVPTNSVFANASAIFLVGNNRLCGGIPELHLPKCTEQENIERKKRTMSHSLKLIILVISAFVVVLVTVTGVTGIYLACIRMKKIPILSESVVGKEFLNVSYAMLLKATSGFSSESLLGSGSFGSVFKGNLNGKIVAVKVLNLQHHAASKSFMTECKALRNVRHRNLVGIITACSSIDFQRNDFRALVYEFMPNGSLDKWFNGGFGNLSLSQRVGVAIDIAHALNYLHHEYETPIVHCDLKPSNILLDNDMVAHVGDFGLVRFLTQPRHPNQSSTIGMMGTIGYAAPEYGLGSEASTAGDVYSYGILLLELITGKSPTDNMFKEHYNLHMYAQEALPDEVLQIIDPTLEEDNLTEAADDRRAIQGALQRRVEFMVSVISVGVLCSNHLPQDRLKITDVISRLQSARDNFLNTERRKNLPARGISRDI